MSACARCHGLMVMERHDDMMCWRCIACGNLLDAVILKNRQAMTLDTLPAESPEA